MPNHTSHNQCFKSWTNWATSFCLIRHIDLAFCQPSTTSSSIWTSFFFFFSPGRKLLQPARYRKFFPRVCWFLKHGLICSRKKQAYFSLAKKLLIVMVPILINKDIFEPSFDDLKFEVKNHNYFCINLNSNFGFCCFWSSFLSSCFRYKVGCLFEIFLVSWGNIL